MILSLSATELRHLNFVPAAPRRLSPEYLQAREAAWETRQASAAAAGVALWNGEIYTLDDALQFDEERVEFRLGTCEYKDIVFRFSVGTRAIAERFGCDHLPRYLTADCIPVTSDGRFVFGYRGATSNARAGALGLIGGTLNKDELLVTSLDDVATVMLREIEEETTLPATRSSLELFALNFFHTKYEFLYTMRLDLTAAAVEGRHREGEFASLTTLSLDELMNFSGPTLDCARYARSYLPRLAARYA